jgi:hypothetical protein
MAGGLTHRSMEKCGNDRELRNWDVLTPVPRLPNHCKRSEQAETLLRISQEFNCAL